jgi:predicted transcriptional regulator
MYATAKTLMSHPVITLQPEMTCEEAIDILITHRIGGAPVVNRQGGLIGVLSLHDVLKSGMAFSASGGDYFSESVIDRMLAQEGFHLEIPTQGFVSDFMTRQVFIAEPDTPVAELAQRMREQRIHRLIILDPRNQKPVGIVSTFDLLRALIALSDPATPVNT